MHLRGAGLWLACVCVSGCALEVVTPDAAVTSPDAGADGGIDAALLDAATHDAPMPDAFVPRIDAGEPCATAGATQMMACGNCGTLTRICSAGFWTYGACTGEGTCAPGATRSVACGFCGTQEQTCAGGCAWDTTASCAGETGTCRPGTRVRTAAGCPPGESRLATCDGTCAEAGGACEAPVCTVGATGTERCGFCGTRGRTCDAFGQWVPGICQDTGLCTPGSTETNACGGCGTQTRTCQPSCTWVADPCVGGLACPTTPPAPTCFDATHVQRAASALPACIGGSECGYALVTLPCAGGCTGAGVCVRAPLLLDGLGGPAGFGPGILDRSDDASTVPLSPAFGPITLYGSSYAALYVNNNGNLTFAGPLGAFTPGFPTRTGAPMIAVWWADVDTRNAVGLSGPEQNLVYYAQEPTRFVATWLHVGYYSSHSDRSNSFQVILTSRSDVALGDFDVELRYQDCEWTTGDASGGVGGLGGSPASAGFSSGDGVVALRLPGSGTSAVLDLCSTSNVGTPGIWRYQVRGGEPL